MCSASSTPASASRYPSWLYEALSSVAESSFCASAEACDEATFTTLASSMAPWLEARVHFNGGMSGDVICAVPESLVRELAAVFTGADPEEPIDASLIDDLMGEFANMVCGRWLTRVSDQSPFDLAAPVVARIESPGAGGAMPSLVNGKPAMCRVVVTSW